eukprot:5120488-Pyramimonas_sp.AAC.1
MGDGITLLVQSTGGSGSATVDCAAGQHDRAPWVSWASVPFGARARTSKKLPGIRGTWLFFSTPPRDKWAQCLPRRLRVRS